MSTEATERELELSDYLRILRHRWPWVVGAIVATTALAVLFTVAQASRFTAEARVQLDTSKAEDILSGSVTNSAFLSREISNEINLANGDSVEQRVRDELAVELNGKLPDVAISAVSGADVLRFVATAPTADLAARYANAWADSYVVVKRQQAQASITAAVDGFEIRLTDLRLKRQETRRPIDAKEDDLSRAISESRIAQLQRELERLEADLEPELALVDTQIAAVGQRVTELQLAGELAGAGTAQVTQVAAAPIAPSNAPMSRNVALGLVVGLILAVALALLIDNLDRTIKTVEDVQHAVNVPLLGTVPRAERHMTERDLALASLQHPEGPIADGYQQIRTALQFAFLNREIHSILVTSANQTEAKTTTSVNLACSMAAVDTRVVLADVDFRRPRVHEVFGCDEEPGLSNTLIDGTPLHEMVLTVEEAANNLVILPAGSSPPSPGDLVATPAFIDVIRLMEKEADLVVLDAPPVLPVSDALTLARNVDAVLMVAFGGKTTRDQLKRSIQNLEQVGANIAGIALIGARHDPIYGTYGYYDEPGGSRNFLKRFSRRR